MQCPSCRFENMPGVTQCGRCGAHLRLGSVAVAIDVHPPRASQHAKRWRRRFRTVPSLRTPLAEMLQNMRRAVLGGWEPPDVPAAGVIRRMIVPGWPQIYCG